MIIKLSEIFNSWLYDFYEFFEILDIHLLIDTV